jgi:hypothetical protein
LGDGTEQEKEQDNEEDLLALTRTFGRAVHRVAGLSRLARLVAFDVVTRLLRAATRGVLLMRSVRMILGFEVLGLLRWTFTIPGHEFSKFERREGDDERGRSIMTG